MGVGYRNQEGYADPVPYLAISNMNVQYYPSCMPTHLLQQYGKIRNESKDVTVPHGAFGYKCYNECVHAYQF